MHPYGIWVPMVSHPEVAEKISPLLNEYWDTNTWSSCPGLVWDAFKAYTRGQYISSIAALKADQSATTHFLQRSVEDQSDNLDPCLENFESLMGAKWELHLHLAEVARLDL